MLCREIYESLEPLAERVIEARDFFGEPVRAFELGSREHPPILLIGDIHGCIRSSEIIADAVLRFAGDAHLIVVPCLFPTIADGLPALSKILCGKEIHNSGEFKTLLLQEYQPVLGEKDLVVFKIGNAVLVFTNENILDRKMQGLLENFKESLILQVSDDGSLKVLQMPNSELFSSILGEILGDTPKPLLSLYFTCGETDETCFLIPEPHLTEVFELADLAANQLAEELLCSRGPPRSTYVKRGIIKAPRTSLEEVFPQQAPSLEVRVGLKSHLEVTRAVLAVLNSAYLLHSILRS